MGTIRQKKLAQAVVKNFSLAKPLNKQELVASVDYSLLNADRNAKAILEAPGVNQELVILGFDPEKAKEVVSEILIGGENDTVKLKAADMIFKVHGTYAAEKHVNLNINQTQDTKLDALIASIEDDLDSGA